MREIKFRAWDRDSQNMVIASTFKANPVNCLKSLSEQAEESRFELMQYTGLKDKNGFEIYEGDVVKVVYEEYPDEDFAIGKVWWFQCYYPAFDVYVPSERAKTGFESYSDGYNAFTCDEISIEVIGNIYENPELLEVKS